MSGEAEEREGIDEAPDEVPDDVLGKLVSCYADKLLSREAEELGSIQRRSGGV